VAIIREYESMPPVFTNEYFSDYHGNVQYAEYNPLRYDYNVFNESVKQQEENCVNMAYELFGDFVEVQA
jgi:hypothetical protein